MSQNWREDPRLKEMDPGKVELLTDFTEQIKMTPKHRIMNRFFALITEARQKGIIFSDHETDLLSGILVEYMAPEDRKKVEMLRMLSRKMVR